MMPLPAWMLEQTDTLDWGRPIAGVPIAPRRRVNVVRRAMAGFAGLLGQISQNAELAERDGLLQRLDARAKVGGLIVLVVVVTLVHRLPTLGAAYGLCMLLAIASRVPLKRLLAAWLAVPLFSAAIVLPATLNIVTPGPALWVLWHSTGRSFGPIHLPEVLAVTLPGLGVAARFVLRTTVCVTLALLLTGTTPPARLFRGLRGLGVPRLFVMLLGMMERYLVVLVRVAEEIHLARRSRSITAGAMRDEQAWVAAGIGSLFRRTQSLGNQVYLAMLSRGYTGEVHLLDEAPMRPRDFAFLGGVAIAAVLLLVWR